MPLSEEQTKRLKTDGTLISFQTDNPKKPGSKSWDRYEKYKASDTVGAASSLGASWSDISGDFERGYLTFKDEDMPGVSKRGAPNGTPDREAQNRAKHKPRDASSNPLMLALPSETSSNTGSAQLEMSAATIATFRAIMREELCDFEQSISSRFETSVRQLREDLQRESHARKELEQRVACLEAAPRPAANSEDIDKTIAVIGGFGSLAANQAEGLIKDTLAEVEGFVDVYTTSPDPVVAFLKAGPFGKRVLGAHFQERPKNIVT